MDPGRKSSLLWGLVGALAFLVLVQAYHLFTRQFLAVPTIAGVTLAVSIVSASLAHLLRPRIRRYAGDSSIE
ncbi:MAG: hypothetical protein ACOCPZ_01425 [Natrialbaceae archaeon]